MTVAFSVSGSRQPNTSKDESSTRKKTSKNELAGKITGPGPTAPVCPGECTCPCSLNRIGPTRPLFPVRLMATSSVLNCWKPIPEPYAWEATMIDWPVNPTVSLPRGMVHVSCACVPRMSTWGCGSIARCVRRACRPVNESIMSTLCEKVGANTSRNGIAVVIAWMLKLAAGVNDAPMSGSPTSTNTSRNESAGVSVGGVMTILPALTGPGSRVTLTVP